MTSIHVQLDDATYERIRQLAAAAGLTPDAYLAQRAQEAASAPTAGAAGHANDGASVIGLFADEPEAVDQMLSLAMRWRRERNRAMFERIDQIAEDLDEDDA